MLQIGCSPFPRKRSPSSDAISIRIVMFARFDFIRTRVLNPALLCRRFSSDVLRLPPIDRIRNVAIVAHVDHGKTTLVNELLSQGGCQVSGDRIMDSISLEKERGITIMSKCTRIQYNNHVLNIVDTPGHSDFGGEVERVLSMVEGIVLVVDASEGPMPQTKFVLNKALQANLSPIVVINKVDRSARRIPGPVENEIFDLFVNLDANDEQLEFPVLYCSAKQGWAVADLSQENDSNKSMKPLYDAIISHIAPPKVDRNEPFRMLVTSIEHDDYLGRIVTGKIYGGIAKVGETIRCLDRNANVTGEGKITKLMSREGLSKFNLDIAGAGDIVSLAGIRAGVTDTVSYPEVAEPLQSLPLDPPTISMTFSVNDGPLAGQDGSQLTSTVLKNRLMKECENNVAVSLKPGTHTNESVEVQGRGELQMGILIEQMRREGFELCVSPPRVLFRRDPETGHVLEPWEEVTVDVEKEFASVVIDKLQRRGGTLLEFNSDSDARNRLVFHIPSRLFIGYRNEFQTDTRGNGIMCSAFHSYQRKASGADQDRKGVLVSQAQGESTAYALSSLEARGTLFIGPGESCYEGMIIGEHNRDTDLDVNPVRAKQLTNIRSAGADERVRLSPKRIMPIEAALTYINEDEMVEITPKHIRLRKKILQASLRKRDSRKAKKEEVFADSH